MAEGQSKKASESGADEVQKAFDEAAEKGFFGDAVDDNDREVYTLRGQSKK